MNPCIGDPQRRVIPVDAYRRIASRHGVGSAVDRLLVRWSAAREGLDLIEREIARQTALAICGEDNAQETDWPDVAMRVAPAVAMLRWRDLASVNGVIDPGNVSGCAWATGVVVGQGRLLTAHHAFDVANGGGCAQLPTVVGGLTSVDAAALMEIHFGYERFSTGQIRPGTRARVRQLLESDQEQFVDCALAVFDGASPAPAIVGRSTRLAAGSPLFCIQHRWNNGQADCCDTVGRPALFTTGEVCALDDMMIAHDIPTLPGASGAPIFDRDGTLVGIHLAGDCDYGPNTALRIERIRDALSNVWP